MSFRDGIVMNSALPPAKLHWIRDRAAYMRLKKHESLQRETPERRAARLEAARRYSQSYVDRTSNERGKRYAARRRLNGTSRLHDTIGSAICVALKGRKAGRKWESIVGYTLANLVRHLERQFAPEMSWENYGRVWHVDHIVPLACFVEYTDETVRAAWALSNLRPLPRLENIRKGAKRLYLL